MILLASGLLSAMVAGGQRQTQTPEAQAQTDESSQKPAGTIPVEPLPELPVSLERIQRALSRPPAIRIRGDRVVFRVEVLGRKPTIEDILGPDYLKGPVPSYGGMTHQGLLNMVTPKDYQGYAAFNKREAMTVAAHSIAFQWA